MALDEEDDDDNDNEMAYLYELNWYVLSLSIKALQLTTIHAMIHDWAIYCAPSALLLNGQKKRATKDYYGDNKVHTHFKDLVPNCDFQKVQNVSVSFDSNFYILFHSTPTFMQMFHR